MFQVGLSIRKYHIKIIVQVTVLLEDKSLEDRLVERVILIERHFAL